MSGVPVAWKSIQDKAASDRAFQLDMLVGSMRLED